MRPSMNEPQILEDDSLFVVTLLGRILGTHKVIKKVSHFYLGFFIITYFGSIIYVFTSHDWHLLLKQYSAVMCGLSLALASYITMYVPPFCRMFWNMYHEMFPSLWSLRSLGKEEFDKTQKIMKATKLILGALLATSFVCATGALPWIDIYDIFIVVKIANDHLEGWLLTAFSTILYSSFYHIAVSIVANIFSFTYLVVHMYNQLGMLIKRLKNLSHSPALNPLKDTEYQDFVSEELISCIKQHQTLLKYSERLNQLLYYPMFYYTAGGILTILSLILFPRTSLLDLVRVVSLGVAVMGGAAGICFLGQILEDQSEEIFVSAYNSSWYLWNICNRKLLWLLLLKSTRKMVVSSSGIININHEVLIKVYRVIYSALTFLLNASKSF